MREIKKGWNELVNLKFSKEVEDTVRSNVHGRSSRYDERSKNEFLKILFYQINQYTTNYDIDRSNKSTIEIAK